MACTSPRQAVRRFKEDGSSYFDFRMHSNIPKDAEKAEFPCRKCSDCRLDYSREWAIRMMHEASLHDSNGFLTLTYSNEFLPEGKTLVKKDMQDFNKRLRTYIKRKIDSDLIISYYYVGEYGEKNARPHYHMCLFNFDFPDKVKAFVRKGHQYYSSEILTKLWGKGNCYIGDLNFKTAAYVARYVTKKVSGLAAVDHYGDRLPEFAEMSRKYPIGKAFVLEFGETDIWLHDSVVVDGRFMKVPRYYDKLLEELHPFVYYDVKESRIAKGVAREERDKKIYEKVAEKAQRQYKRPIHEYSPYHRREAKRKITESRLRSFVRECDIL